MTLFFDGVGAEMASDAPVAREIAPGDVVATARVRRSYARGAGSVVTAVEEGEVGRH